MRLTILQGFTARAAALLVLAIAGAGTFTSCEETQEPPEPFRITISSGNNQFSRVGTELEQPLTVAVVLSDGTAAERYDVEFEILSGGGTLSNPTDRTNDAGLASTRLTLGPDEGMNRVRATVLFDRSLSVEFAAEGSAFYCPEEDGTFQRKFTPAGSIYLFTRQSRHLETEGRFDSGIIRITPQFTTSPFVATTRVVTFPDPDGGAIQVAPKDCAFGRNGDFFTARLEFFPEVVKLEADRSYNIFSALDDVSSELDGSPGAILMGCDMFGPFAVGCRDTLTRIGDLMYSGVGDDRCSDDAFAVDPATQDLYYIYFGDNSLMRFPVDSLVAEGPEEMVAALTEDEARGARGMVVNDDDGDVFILVDTANTKVILRVTPSGTKTTEFDFTTRGADEAAGEQNDLAINRQGTGILYTIDTLNNVLLAWDIGQGTLTELPPHPTLSIPEALSLDGSSGERVGLVVLP